MSDIAVVAGTDTANPLAGYMSEADYLRIRGITKRQAQRERKMRKGPPFVVVGRSVWYRVSGFQDWLRRNEVQPLDASSAHRRRS